MNRSLLTLGIAAVAAVSIAHSAAIAKGATVTIAIDGHCNVEVITLGHGKAPGTIREAGDGCDNSIGVGGFVMGTSIQGKVAGFSLTSATAPGITRDLVFANPYKTGSTITMYCTFDGKTQVYKQATYTVLHKAPQSPDADRSHLSSFVPSTC